MHPLHDLATSIDAASDAGDEVRLRQLAEDCEKRLASAKGKDQVLLRYFASNIFAGLIASKEDNADYAWSWMQPDGLRNILLLREAIRQPDFAAIDPIVACQIRTNLGNRLNALGRPIAANEQWKKALMLIPNFAKALANRANGLAYYGGIQYDQSHKILLLDSARSMFDQALASSAFWESDDRDSIVPNLREKQQSISSYMAQIGLIEDYDLNQWSLGSTEEENSYRRWCLNERLFLNPLNDAYTDSVAATDVFHLPSHTYKMDEQPRFPAYYNILKQEYVSARYRLFRAIHKDDPDYLMRDVLMLESGEGQSLGHYTDELRCAFRSAYAIFDKIGLFLNDYFQIGLSPRRASFRRIWYASNRADSSALQSVFENRSNWPLRGLYFTSKDLFDDEFNEVSEPDASDLARLRHQLEHRFLSFHDYRAEGSTETHGVILIGEFERKTLRLLRIAREALIYLSLSMHREETLRRRAPSVGEQTIVPILSVPIESFRKW